MQTPGFCFLSLSVDKSSFVANTWFQQPPGRRATYCSPGTTHLPITTSEILTYLPTLVFSDSRQVAQFLPECSKSTQAKYDSDHFPVVTNYKIKLGTRKKQPRPPQWNFRGATGVPLVAMHPDIEKLRGVHPVSGWQPSPTGLLRWCIWKGR